jgi:hypothetical protein
MNTIGPSQPIIPIKKTASVPQMKPAVSAPTFKPSGGADQLIDTKAAEQRRFETVKRLAEDIANVFVIGDQRFTIFKDSTGQYITRFTSLRDGRVTYIPEPQLFKMHGSSQVSLPSITLKV